MVLGLVLGVIRRPSCKIWVGGGGGGQGYYISRNFAAQRAAPVFQMEKEGGVK